MADMGELMSLLGTQGVIDCMKCESVDECRRKLSSNDSNFSILHMNIRSLQKNFDEFLVFMESLKPCEIQCIVLTETWCVANVDSYKIEGYKAHYNQASFNKCDGTILYIKDNCIFEVSNVKFREVTAVSCRIKLGHINCHVTGLYRPPSTNENMFIEDLEQYIQDSYTCDFNILVGDINININDPNNLAGLTYLNTLSQYNYLPCINAPTRVTDQSESCIDHIFIKMRNHIYNPDTDKIKALVCNTAVTDHYTTMLNLTFENHLIDKIEKSTIKTKINYTKLNNYLAHEKWEELQMKRGVQCSTNIFIDRLTHYLELSSESFTVKNKFKKIKPWITTGLITSIKYRDKLKNKWLRNKYNTDIETAYKNYRNQLTRLLRLTKNDYYRNKISNCSNFKEKWEVINEITGNKKVKTKIGKIKTIEGILVDDEISMANNFNDFFVGVGRNLSLNYIPEKETKLTQFHKSFFLEPTDKTEIFHIINSLKNNCAPGTDNISATVLKKVHHYVIDPIVTIINSIFQTGDIPQQFKDSIVVPVFKGGSSLELTNYRPICIVNSLAKIFEKTLKVRLIKFLETNNLLFKNQYGFREKLSTENALQQLTSDVVGSFEKNEKVIGIFLDLKKAFDTVSHSRLILKLEAMGIRGLTLKLFKNYLKDRQQVVKIGDTYSNCRVIETGVPQGTVLGPVLFLIYINDILVRHSLSHNIVAFADDALITYKGETWEGVYAEATRGINILRGELCKNLLSLNIQKTKYITFAPTVAGLPLGSNHIKIHDTGEKIDRVTHINYLGIIVDAHLKWNYHAEYLNGRIRRILPSLFIMRHILSLQNLFLIYRSFVESLLRYGIACWGAAYDTTLKHLQVTQNFIIKTLLKKNNLYSTELLYNEHTNVFNIKGLYILIALQYTYLNESKYNHVDHHYSTRPKVSKHLVCTRASKNVTQRYIEYYGPRLYNHLPINLRNIRPYVKFKKKLKPYIINNFTALRNVA